MLGYELTVTADLEGKPSTRLRVTPGAIPDLRLRVTPVLAKVGDTITAQLIRGPDFRGELPKKLEREAPQGLEGGRRRRGAQGDARRSTRAPRAGSRSAAAACARWSTSSRRRTSRSRSSRSRTATSRATRPSSQIQTLIGGTGGKAAVGLFGVDDSLGQLVPLAGPGDLARVRPKVETCSPAFGMLDGQALALGRIRGANAAAATVLRVSDDPEAARARRRGLGDAHRRRSIRSRS